MLPFSSPRRQDSISRSWHCNPESIVLAGILHLLAEIGGDAHLCDLATLYFDYIDRFLY
jgi:hypothetical protein